MNSCLQLKKANCKNCYKCIRYCPIKAIKIEDNQAQIIKDECILCGRCFVHCPQNAKQIRNDVHKAKDLIASGHEVYVSIAPAFIANYNGISASSMEKALIELGFTGAEETAIGATIVKKQYEDLVKSRKQKIIISSCCHSVNTLIQKQYPKALTYLAKIMSPMQAHCSKLKQEHPDCYTVFIGPCISKKDEAGRYENIVDCVLTFEELTEWFSDEGVTFEDIPDTHEKGRARLFPTAGGILRTMDLEDDFSYVSVDGVGACITALNDIELGNLDNCFIEMSACRGSCIGGPAMDKDKLRHVSEYVRVNRTASHKDFSVNRPLAEAISKDFPYEGVHKQMPGSLAIKEILAKMGKTLPEQELNCGSCGYNTCREKAIAVLMGKADLSMCLPYLKEKAESFSDKIINNTPNGIFVLNEKLEIQQMNSAAGKIFNIKNTCEAVGKPVVDILDPTDYLLTMTGIPNVYEKKRFLTEYEKYVEETIIFDRDYHIIMSIMKDVTDEEHIREKKDIHSQRAIEITDRVVEKQMRIVQEIASLLGETTAETKIALTKLKETLTDE